MNSTVKSLLFWMVLVVAGVLIWNFSTKYQTRDHQLTFSEFMTQVDGGNVSHVVITGQEVTGVTKDNPNQTFRSYAPTQYEGLANKLIERGVALATVGAAAAPVTAKRNTASDSLIKRNLEGRLLLTKDVWVINYSLDVTEGTAYIIGRVKDTAELNRVLNVARTTRGVKRVVSHLQVNPDTQNGTTLPPAATMTQPANAATVVQPSDPIESTTIPPVTPNGGY